MAAFLQKAAGPRTDPATTTNREMNPMSEQQNTQNIDRIQCTSPLAQDMVTCAIHLADLGGRVGREEWELISRIRQQILAAADVAEGLLIPEQAEGQA